MFALTRDQLIECAALVRGIRRGNLDTITLRDAPLDILSQQIVASCAAEDIAETELVEMVRGAALMQLADSQLEQILVMVSEGVSDRRGRTFPGIRASRSRGGHAARAARERGSPRSRRAARFPTTITTVVQFPEETPRRRRSTRTSRTTARPATSSSSATPRGSIKPHRGGARARRGCAKGQPPTRSRSQVRRGTSAHAQELSDEVSSLRGAVDREALRYRSSLTRGDRGLARRRNVRDAGRARADADRSRTLPRRRAALGGALPRKDLLIAERFFDEAGGMQLVIHAPLGGRIKRAWGLALRKRFCKTFDFELQAASGHRRRHRDLARPAAQLRARDRVRRSCRRIADPRRARAATLLDRPMFEISLAVERHAVARRAAPPRRRTKVPPHLMKMRVADTLSVVFPQAQACGENIVGDREIPDHPLVFRDDPRLPRRGDGLRGQR